ncbi:metallophosphoesterase [Williamsia sp. CHRR-6]|uniref:metallophosphoesterase n=1 Tax=Williamsia sp. CHRR-6 TaxID=2835871 RepID=UPI001BDA7B46|nr:metallophosphoesterase [Williamsia sp. CHRR-6]MBT0567321.1 metallophosphoesterase [Williamsia sp. CHRR-6]
MPVVAHISDLHFNGTAGRRDRIRSVLDYVAQRADGIDVLVVTGDITDEATTEQYAEAAEVLAAPIPMLLVPGNHDDRRGFATLVGDPPADAPINHAEVVAGTLFLMCDSTIAGRPDGFLSDTTLSWMAAQIGAVDIDTPVVICFHHPPAPVLMTFMDSIRQTGEQRLADLVGRYPNVVGMLCGHVHSGSVTTFAGRPLVTAPGVSSTLNLDFEGSEILNETQPAGLAFHQLDGWRLITHFRAVH